MATLGYWLRRERERHTGPWRWCQVSDDGTGISPENLERIFDRFFQEDSAHAKTRAVAHNVGLGLSISKAIVDTHGGRIEVRSRPGHETCFTIRLPSHPPPAGEGGPA